MVTHDRMTRRSFVRTHGGYRHDRNQQRGGAAALPEADANRQPRGFIPTETGSALIATSSNQTRALCSCAPLTTRTTASCGRM